MNIYTAISAVMQDCGAVGKDSKNQQQNYQYRGIDAVMNAINPALTKNKVFVAPEVLEQSREERQTSKGGLLIYSIVKVKYTFFAEDGSSVSAVVVGEGMDSGDKATNKAMSAAFKYALFQVFCIPTEEMIDSEKDSLEPEPKKPAEKRQEPKQTMKQQAKDSNKSAMPVNTNKDNQIDPDAPISEELATMLVATFRRCGIDPWFACNLYGVKNAAGMSKKQMDNALQHLEDIKKKQEEKK